MCALARTDLVVLREEGGAMGIVDGRGARDDLRRTARGKASGDRVSTQQESGVCTALCSRSMFECLRVQ